MRRLPDPEQALRVAADECFLAGLRGERPLSVESYLGHRDEGQRVNILTTGPRQAIVVIAWRTP